LPARRLQWNDEQRRRKREARARRRRLADMRDSLSNEALTALKHRAEEALATDGLARTRLGYEVLVKLTIDDLLELEGVQIPASADGAHPAHGSDGEALRRPP
jgi:hypothetical protein